MGEHEQSGLLRNVVVIGIVSMVGIIVIFAAIGLRLNMSMATSTATSNVAQNIKNANEDGTMVTDEAATSNYYYDYNTSNKTATISSIKDRSKLETNVVVPVYVNYNNERYTVVGINDYAYSSTDMTSVMIPGTIKTIGKTAFGYSKLNTVIFNEGLETIDNDAFASTKLSSVILPDSVKTVGTRAFADIAGTKDSWISIGKNTTYSTDGYNSSFGKAWSSAEGKDVALKPIVRS